MQDELDQRGFDLGMNPHEDLANDDLDHRAWRSRRPYRRWRRGWLEQYRQQHRHGRLEQAGAQLTAPLEQHIGVDGVLASQCRHRDAGCAGFPGKALLEVGGIVRTAFAVGRLCICVLSSSHHRGIITFSFLQHDAAGLVFRWNANGSDESVSENCVQRGWSSFDPRPPIDSFQCHFNTV